MNYKIYSNYDRKLLLSDKKYEVNNELKLKLKETKNKIDKVSLRIWDYHKKHINNYEYVYCSNKNLTVSQIYPISRSYFKLIQILKDFNIDYNSIICSCICDGPGGFIQCLHDYYNQKIKKIYGITLVNKNDSQVPFWNKKLFNQKKNIFLYGNDKTGNIYNIDNAKFFINNSEKSNIVTCDGGFDFTEDYNSQENNSFKLLFCEIFISLNIQSINGNLIIKFFDIFNQNTCMLLYILYCNYETINIFKPDMSRLSNSEKYIICENFVDKSSHFTNIMEQFYDNPYELNIDIPAEFINSINEINIKHTNTQIIHINNVLNNIKLNIKYDSYDFNKSILWCKKYNIPVKNKF